MSAAKQDGGPAFPSHFNTAIREGMGGMTLRDYFAAKALSGLVVNGENFDPAKLTAYCYEFADAMLKARQS